MPFSGAVSAAAAAAWRSSSGPFCAGCCAPPCAACSAGWSVGFWLAWFGFYRKAYVRRQTFWEELRQTVLAAMVFTMLSSRLLNQIPNWEQIRSALLLYPLLVCSIVPGRALARLARSVQPGKLFRCITIASAESFT